MNFNGKNRPFKNTLNYGDEDLDNEKGTPKCIKFLIGLGIASIALSLGIIGYIHIINRNREKKNERIKKPKKRKQITSLPYEYHVNQRYIPYDQPMEMEMDPIYTHQHYNNLAYNYSPTPPMSRQNNHTLTRGIKKNYKNRNTMPVEQIRQNVVHSPQLNVTDYTLSAAKNVWEEDYSDDENYESD